MFRGVNLNSNIIELQRIPNLGQAEIMIKRGLEFVVDSSGKIDLYIERHRLHKVKS